MASGFDLIRDRHQGRQVGHVALGDFELVVAVVGGFANNVEEKGENPGSTRDSRCVGVSEPFDEMTDQSKVEIALETEAN